MDRGSEICFLNLKKYNNHSHFCQYTQSQWEGVSIVENQFGKTKTLWSLIFPNVSRNSKPGNVFMERERERERNRGFVFKVYIIESISVVYGHQTRPVQIENRGFGLHITNDWTMFLFQSRYRQQSRA